MSGVMSMSRLTAALWAEALKARRSRLPWVTAIGFSLAPLMGGLFMLILKDPALARRFGILSAKAQLAGSAADWSAYFGLLAQATAVGGSIVFGLIVIWLFGREYSDRTIKDLLALPTTRAEIVVAKFVVFVIWTAMLTALLIVLSLGIGGAIGLPGWSIGLAMYSAAQIGFVAILTLALVMPIAWVASAGRGYLPPVGFMILTLFLAQVIALLGWGAYFPWSVPALLSGAAGPGGQGLGVVSYLLVALTVLAGFVGTLAWWQYADQT
jgi:ABC-2 type transport system permease protein